MKTKCRIPGLQTVALPLSLAGLALGVGACAQIYVPGSTTEGDSTQPTGAPATTSTTTTTTTGPTAPQAPKAPETALWTKLAGGEFVPERLLPLPDGSLVVAGWLVSLSATPVFGKGEPGETRLPPSLCGPDGCDDVLARYRADGTLAWAKRFGSPGTKSNTAALLADGSIVVTGSVIADYSAETSIARFGAGEPNETTFEANGQFAAYAARFRAEDGALQWVRRSTSDSGANVIPRGVAPTKDGGFSVCGDIDPGTHTFNVGTPTAKSLMAQGYAGFVLEYAGDGALRSARSYDASGPSSFHGCSRTPDGGLLVSGAVEGTVRFGATTLQPEGWVTALSLRLDAAGEPTWASAPKTSNGADAWSLTDGGQALPDGGTVVFGRFADTTMTFGAGEPGAVQLSCGPAWGPSPAPWCGWVAAYRADGTLAWAHGSVDAWPTSLTLVGGQVLLSLTGLGGTFGIGEAAPLKFPGATQSGVVVALEPARGNVLWSRRLLSRPVNTYPQFDDDLLIAGRPDGTLAVGAGLMSYHGDSRYVVLPDGPSPLTLGSEPNELLLTVMK